MNFIIFDLDDTLLCGDCEREWINFLFSKGLLKDPETILNKFDLEYRKGVLNFVEYSRFIQKPIKGLSKEKVNISWAPFYVSTSKEINCLGINALSTYIILQPLQYR